MGESAMVTGTPGVAYVMVDVLSTAGSGVSALSSKSTQGAGG